VVATPQFLEGRQRPATPADLREFDSVAMRSVFSGRVIERTLQDASGRAELAAPRVLMTVNDPEAVLRGVLMHLGIGLLAMPDVVNRLENGALVRLLPDWYQDPGAISLYFTSQKLLPAKTRALVDFVTEQFRAQGLARRFSAALPI